MDTSSETGADVQVRTVQAGDKAAGGLPSPPPDRDGPSWRRTLVAIVEGQVVGFATLTLSPATDTYFCDVSVSPAHRRRGIGTHLFTRVQQQVADRHRPILGRAMSSQPIRRHFAEHLGGSVVAHCAMPSIDPASIGGRRWTDAQRLPDGYETTPMADVSAEEVQTAWSGYFTWAHQPFGAIRVEALPSVWDGYRAGVDDTLSYLCRDPDGQLVAFSFVSPEVWDGRTFVVAETVHRNQMLGLSMLQATLAASLRALAERGIQRVEIEGHTTDAHIPRLFQTLPAGPSDPLDIYLLTPTDDPASASSISR
jgi:GNAT superfamily N-acetyltransferase